MPCELRMRARPSWGRRRSAMSMPDMIFNRDGNAAVAWRGTVVTSCSTPSMR
jgi:hypothetical protein